MKFKLLLILILLSWNVFAQTDNYLPNLEYKLNSDTLKDASRLKILTELASGYQHDYLAKSIKYGLLADSLAAVKDIEPDMMIYHVIYKAGRLSNMVIHDYKYLDLLIEKTENENDPLKLARICSDIGTIFFNTDRYEQGMDYQTRSIRILEEKHLEQQFAKPYFILMRVYQYTEDKGMERYYRDKFLSYADTTKDHLYLATAYYNLGDEFRHLSAFERADEAYLQVLKYAEKMNDTVYMMSALGRIAFNAYEAGELERSLEYYEKTLELALLKNDIKVQGNCYGNMANVYRDWEEYDRAMEYYELSIDKAKGINYIYNIEWVYKDYSKMFAQTGDYESAYDYMLIHSQYADSLEVQEYRMQLAREQSRIEELRTQQEMEFLAMKLKNNKITLYSLIGGVVLILLISFLMIRSNRLKSKQKITDMNTQISSLTQKNLRQQMNPHFVFNTLNSIQYYVFQNDKIAANDYMSMFARLMRKILENSQHTSIPIAEEIDALELYLKLESIRFKNKFTWEVSIDDEIDTLTYKIPTMLIQPYVENSITHGLRYKEGKGNIWIDLKLVNNHILCTIEDNGIGRNNAMKIKKVDGDEHNSLGTTITESRLNLVNALYGNNMKVEYKDLTDESGESSGTRVEINIPIIT